MGYKHVMCVFQKCSKKMLSPKMCVEIETYTICYMYEMCVFWYVSEKRKSQSKNESVEIFLKIFKVSKSVCVCFFFFFFNFFIFFFIALKTGLGNFLKRKSKSKNVDIDQFHKYIIFVELVNSQLPYFILFQLLFIIPPISCNLSQISLKNSFGKLLLLFFFFFSNFGQNRNDAK